MLHLSYPYLSYNIIYFSSLVLSLLLILVYCILQMSYTLVSHNFGLNMLDYGYVSFTFSVILISSLIIYFLSQKIYNFSVVPLSYTFRKNIVLVKTIKYLSINKLFKYVLMFYVIYFYILSFNPIINNVF